MIPARDSSLDTPAPDDWVPPPPPPPRDPDPRGLEILQELGETVIWLKSLKPEDPTAPRTLRYP